MKNYFILLDILESIKIDTALLDKKFYTLIKKNHPDFTHNLSNEEKEKALQTTADLNEAKKIFSDEDKTIFYLLQLKKMVTQNEKYMLDNLFLMEMLELNEQLDTAINENNFLEIQSVKQALDKQKQELYNEISDIILSYNKDQITTQNLEKLKVYHYKKQYLHRIAEKIK